MQTHPEITLWKKGVGLIVHNDGTRMYCPNIINGARHFLLLYYNNYYDPPPIQLEADDVVVDVGGWVGSFAIYAAKKAKKVFVSEPLPHILEFLKLNVKVNELDNVVISEKGVAGACEERKLHFLSRDPEMGYLHETDGHTHFDGNVGIKVVTLDKFVKENSIGRIDFLKLNCEGAEGEIIPDVSEPLWKKIRKVAIQIHEKLSPVSGDKLLEMFLKHGFKVEDKYKPLTERWAYCWRE